MLLPIGHDQSIRSWPWVTIGIIVICTLMQAYSSFGAPSHEDVVRRVYAIAERHDTGDAEATPEQVAAFERDALNVLDELPEHRFGYTTGTGFSLTLITAAFVHGGWLRLIGNMLFLWLAGSALEDRYGRIRFALFYCLGAIAATLAFSVMAKEDGILLVGASGAVSACMGAFLIHFARTQIRFWYFLMFRTGTFQMPAWVALPLWLAEQFLWASTDGAAGQGSGVAYGAHIGGFGFGIVAGFIMSKVFPDDAANDEVEYDAPPAASARGKVAPEVEDRLARTYAAIDKRDIASVRTLSSRVILDLARANDNARVLDLYSAIATRMTQVPLTVAAFAAAALAADRQNDSRTYITVATAMIAEHPLGLDTPKVMWRLSQIHGDAGSHEIEKETLASLAKRFPRDDFGQRAQRALDGGRS